MTALTSGSTLVGDDWDISPREGSSMPESAKETTMDRDEIKLLPLTDEEQKYLDGLERSVARLRAAVNGDDFEWEINGGSPFDDVTILLADYDRVRAAQSYSQAECMTVTAAMVSAAIEAAWPGPEIVYADEHDSAESMMRAALEAALSQPQRRDALKAAIGHIDHMAAWITKQNAGYSFESLGEDMPGIRAALAAQPANSGQQSPPMNAAPRAPTEAMLVAARDWSYLVYGKPIGNGAATGCWQAMFDAALSREEQHG